MTSKYASRQFWIDTADRAVATTAQAAVATLTAGVTGLLQIDPVQLASVAGLAGVVSVLTSVAFRGGGDTPTTVTWTPEERAEQYARDADVDAFNTEHP